MVTEDHFVLFADMLGFKDLVKNHKVPLPEHLDFKGRLDGYRGGSIAGILNFGNPLGDAFTAFHSGVRITADRHWSNPVNLIVFSDSLFLATISWQDCLGFAESLMRYCIGQEAPVRMGIGRGTFVPYGFAFEEDPKLRLFSSQFFGTGVIYAVEAEKHLKGLRIAVHQSAAQSLASTVEAGQLNCYKLVSLSQEQRCASITHEWNCLGEFTDFGIEYSGEAPDRSVHTTMSTHIDAMRGKSKEAPEISRLYDDTKNSFAQMVSLIDAHDEQRRTRKTLE